MPGIAAARQAADILASTHLAYRKDCLTLNRFSVP
jgi:hypothetical protein